jgi:hypothetical protein
MQRVRNTRLPRAPVDRAFAPFQMDKKGPSETWITDHLRFVIENAVNGDETLRADRHTRYLLAITSISSRNCPAVALI